MKYRLSFLICFSFLVTNSQTLQLNNNLIKDIKENMSAYSHYYFERLYAYDVDPLGKVKIYSNTFFLKDYDLEIDESALYNYPKKNIQLFYVENVEKRYFTDVKSDPIDYLLSKRILIGYDKNENSIIYISGDVFKNYISQDFLLDQSKPETFNNFLEIELYNYWIENIRFIGDDQRYLFFKAYSKIAKDDILIKVQRYSYDFIQVKTVKYNWTEQGSYKWIDD